MPEDREATNITFGELFRIILKKIWVVLGAAVLATLATALLFAFIFNPIYGSYGMRFRIVYPGSMDLKYPDGSPFYYQDIIAEEHLAAVKASDERFASIDIERMVDEDAIEITAETENTATQHVYTVQYHISVQMSYFPNREVATDFIKALATMPEEKVNAIAGLADYTLDESAFERAAFSVKLDLLAEQKANITEQYRTWSELIGSSYHIQIGDTSETLFSYASKARSAFNAESSLRLKLDQYDFQSEDVASERASLEQEYEVNLRKIAALRASQNPLMYAAARPLADSSNGDMWYVEFPEPELTTDQMLQKLITRNEDIITLLGTYDPDTHEFDGTGTLATELPAFVAEVNRQFMELKETAQTASLVSKALYDQETYTRFESMNAEEESNTNLVVVTLGSFVLWFVVACVVVCIVDYPKYKRAKGQSQPDGEEKNETETTEE